MAIKIERAKRSKFSWAALGRVGLTAAFLFWIYIIWNSTTELDNKLNVATDRYSVIHTLQVEFKNEVQEWKNLLLRSNNQSSLAKNWQTFETQHQKVAAAAQDILRQNDTREISQRMTDFAAAHAANFASYKNSMETQARNNFNPDQADAQVKGIDRPLLENLEAVEVAMEDEKRRLNESMTAQVRSQIEQSLVVLGFIALLAVWMPR